jgi:hypothetical protein
MDNRELSVNILQQRQRFNHGAVDGVSPLAAAKDKQVQFVDR